MLAMTVSDIMAHLSQLDPKEKLIIGWWDKEFFIECEEFRTTDEERDLEPDEIQAVWDEVCEDAIGRLERETEFIYGDIVNHIQEVIGEFEKDGIIETKEQN